MARTPKPQFRADRQAHFVTINGTRHKLGSDKKQADRQFHELMAQVNASSAPSSTSPAVAPSASSVGLSVGDVFEKFLDWCQTHRSARA